MAKAAHGIIALLLSGCASFDLDWRHTRPASVRPWLYIYALDTDLVCRGLGADAATRHRINGCARWKAQGCVIVLPENPPAWLIEHEEKHCEGWTHG